MGKTVLLADDHEDSLAVFATMLEHHGYRVLRARTGTEALELARRELPDLILMDLWMPEIDGWEATRTLKADGQTAGIQVVAISANVQMEVRQRAFDAGCVSFLEKPIEPMQVVAEVRLRIG